MSQSHEVVIVNEKARLVHKRCEAQRECRPTLVYDVNLNLLVRSLKPIPRISLLEDSVSSMQSIKKMNKPRFLILPLMLGCFCLAASAGHIAFCSSAQAEDHVKKVAAKTNLKPGGEKQADKSGGGAEKHASAAGKGQSGKKIEAWEIKQSSKMVGPITCLLAPEAVWLRAEKLNITWIFKAPKWEAFLYNTETKNFCSLPYEQWKDRGFFMPSGKSNKAKSDLHEMKMSKSGKTKEIAGLKAHEIVITRRDGVKYGELWIASNVVAPKQFSELVSSMVMLPMKATGAPIEASIFQSKVNKIVPVLSTESAKKSSVDASLFEPLKGYNRVKDEMALMFAESPDSGSPSGLFGGLDGKDVMDTKKHKGAGGMGSSGGVRKPIGR